MNRQTNALLGASIACCTLFAAAGARAHVCMDEPLSRVGRDCNFLSDQKVGPCGVNQRGTNVTEFRPGETITVKINETIDHPSHFRIAFNPNGQDFEDPTSKDDNNGAHPYILLDNIVDESAAVQQVRVTLPNVTCDKCTLQLIQVMYDKIDSIIGIPGFGGADGKGTDDNDDIYYACADIVLRGSPSNADGGAAVDAGPLVDASTGSAVEAGVLDAGTVGGATGGSSGGTVDSGAASGAGGTTGGVAGTNGGGSSASVAGGSAGGSAGGAVGAGTAGGVVSGTSGGAPPTGDDPPSDDGCDCSVSGAPRYGNLVGMILLALGLLVRRRRFAR